jgi:hypothetical protein
MATKRAVAKVIRVAGKDQGNGKGGKSEAMATKRVIARKRAMLSDNNNKTMATETMTKAAMMMATNTMTMTMMPTMTMKTTTKMTTPTVWQRWRAVAGGGWRRWGRAM